jgi:hypothetical protein
LPNIVAFITDPKVIDGILDHAEVTSIVRSLILEGVLQGSADRLHTLANRSMTYVSCADGEWLSGVQLSPDGAENNIEVVN